MWKMNNLSDNIKLPVDTLIFRSYYDSADKTIHAKYHNMWNNWTKKEIETLNAQFIIYPKAPHFLWYDKKCSYDIIERIKCKIYQKN